MDDRRGKKRRADNIESGVAESEVDSENASVSSREPSSSSSKRCKVWDERLELLTQESQKISSGEHWELKQKCKGFEQRKMLRQHAATKYSELQTKNIEAMYEYEVQQAEHFYEASKNELQAKLLEEVNAQIKKLEEMKARGTTEKEEKVARALETRNKLRKKKGVGAEEKDPKENGSSRSSFKKTGVILDSRVFAQTITEADIKSDLAAMEKDWRQKVKSHKEKFGPVGRQDVDVERGKLKLGNGQTLEKADDVVVTSHTTDEDFYGSISEITSTEVLLRLTDGTRGRVYLSHLRNGRATIALAWDEQASAPAEGS